MRGWGAVWFLSLLLVPSIAGHGEHEAECDMGVDAWNHIQLWTLELGPGETVERTLGFNRCPLEAGWQVLLRGDTNGIVDVLLDQNDARVGTSFWNGTGGFEAWTLQHTDFATLRLHNPGTENATARLYFDQTCLCPAKATELVPGPVWLNALAAPGDSVSFEVVLVPVLFPADALLPETLTVQAMVDGRNETQQSWLFQPLVDASCQEGTRWMACFTYTFEATEAGRQDVLLWLDHDSAEAWQLQVRPVIEGSPAGTDAPGLGVPLFFVAIASVALLLRRC